MSAKDEEYDRNAGLASLTDEERAALEEDELSDDEKAALQELADDDDDANDDDDGVDDSDDSPGAAATDTRTAVAPSAKAAEPVAPPAVADKVEDDDSADDSAPVVYQVALPKDFDARVKALDDAEAEVANKFEVGDIEAQEYVRETRRIAKERGELDRAQVKAEMAAEMSQQAAMHQWQQQVDKFVREAKKVDGIDYRGNEALGTELDMLVKALANNPAHADKPSAWFLQQAHKAVKAMHGIADKPAPDAKTDKSASRKPPIDKAPKTLAQVPGGEGPGDVNDEFANLDNLEGDAYEFALAKLTPAQRERYLASV